MLPRLQKKKPLLVLTIVLFTIALFLFSSFNLVNGHTQTLALFTTSPTTNYAALVDPFIGTGPQRGAPYGGGNTFPGATVPFGMVQWSPDTVINPPGGYAFRDQRLKGFSLTHLSGAGCRIYQDIPFLPYTGAVTTSPALTPARYTATFTHAHETASAGYYKVRLNNGVTAELSATQRTGVARLLYPLGRTATLLVNVSGSTNGVSQAQASISGNTISGFASSGTFCHHADHYTVYFFARFSQFFASSGTWQDQSVSPGGTSVRGNHVGAYVTFNTSNTSMITVSVGLSYVSVANAQANLNAEDAVGNFDLVHAQAIHTWNAALSKIQISSSNSAQVTTFYTALYHTLLSPNIFSDASGQYMGFNGKIQRVAPGHIQYANFSGWDIYRSEAQLLAFLMPMQASDMAQSLVNDDAQSGMLPRWGLANADTYDMVGDSADAILADIYAFGGTQFNTTAALQAMIHQATTPNQVRLSLNYLLTRGYIPQQPHHVFCGAGYYGSAACSLEYNTADFALGAFALALGDTATYQRFVNRAQYWQTLLNPRDGYLEPRSLNGSFPSPYRPASPRGWVEGNGAQYTWMVPFNLSGLFQALGGNRAVIARLNTFFTQLNAGPNAPYAFLGNEPSLEVPWEYDYAGAPYRTQEVVRRIANTLYTPGTGGLAGNDDLGEMSSWYVWATLGMFPETPGTANLVLTSPLFPRITITRDNGQTLTITAPSASATVFFVQSLKVNGMQWSSPWLSPSFLQTSGTLNYTLATTANTGWGSNPADAPPSYGSVIGI